MPSIPIQCIHKSVKIRFFDLSLQYIEYLRKSDVDDNTSHKHVIWTLMEIYNVNYLG